MSEEAPRAKLGLHESQDKSTTGPEAMSASSVDNEDFPSSHETEPMLSVSHDSIHLQYLERGPSEPDEAYPDGIPN